MYKHKIPYYTSLKCLHIKTHTHKHSLTHIHTHTHTYTLTHTYTHTHLYIRTDKIDLQNLVPF